MGQSLVQNYLHIVFSTKHRESLIDSAVESELYGYLGGYGAFSVNPSEVDVVIGYIANQKEHHRKKTFQDEYRAFLKKYKVDYDERYVWD